MSTAYKIAWFNPARALSPYFHSYWISRVSADGDLPKVFMPPTGFVTILLSFGSSAIQLRYYGHEWKTCSPATISGQYFNYTELFIPPSYETVGIFIRPGAIYQALGVDMPALTHSVMNAADIFGNDINELVNRLKEFNSDERRIDEVNTYFLKKFKCVKYQTPIVNDSIRLITEAKGNIRVTAVSDYFKCSTRYLEKQFTSSTGISPKYLARVVQFNNTLSILRSEPNIKWPDLIGRSGYYDQSHLIKTFIEFTGKTPLSYANSSNELTEIHLN
ncbi:AraC family transcriptional regulator [Cytophagales bacterium WSM2-2]|nr:AraC family transcriptional regulator [Cytophagales bacterium WSM2-2]